MNKRTFKNFVPIRLISFFTVLAFLAAMMPSAVLADDEKADYAMAVFGKETKFYRMTETLGGESMTTKSVIDGKECIVGGKDTGYGEGQNGLFFQFSVDKDFMYNLPNGTPIEVTVEYYDGPVGSFAIYYDSYNSSGMYPNLNSTETVYLSGSMEWKTHTFYIEDHRMTKEKTAIPTDFRLGMYGVKMGMSTGRTFDIAFASVKVEYADFRELLDSDLKSTKIGNIFGADEDMEIRHNLRNKSDKNISAAMQYKLYDSKERLVEEHSETADFDPKEEKTVGFKLNNLNTFDIYRIECSLSEWYADKPDEKKAHTYEESVTRAMLPAKGNPGFGACQQIANGRGTPEDVGASMQSAGLTMLRDDVVWGRFDTEEEKAENLPILKERIEILKSHGVNYLALLWNNALKTMSDGGNVPVTDEELDEWEEYCALMARELKGYTDYFEIWNEYNIKTFNTSYQPPEAYVELLKRAYKAIKKENPNAVVAGGSPSEVDLVFLENIFKLGALNYMDVLSIHPYDWSGQFREGRYVKNMTAAQELMDKYKRRLPIWNTELGFGTCLTDKRYGHTREEQCAAIVRGWILNKSTKLVDMWTYYMYTDMDNPTDGESCFGMVNRWSNEKLTDYGAKESFLAVSAMNSMVGADAEVADSFENYTAREYAVNFYNSSMQKNVLVMESYDKSVQMSFYLGCNEVDLLDMYGNKMATISSQNGVYSFNVGMVPMYAVGKFNAFEKAENTEGVNADAIEKTCVASDIVKFDFTYSGDEALMIDAEPEDGIEVIQNNGFKNGAAELVLSVAPGISGKRKMKITVKNSDGVIRYCAEYGLNISDPIEMTITNEEDENGGNNHHKVRVSIKNVTQSKRLGGEVFVSAPEDVAAVNTNRRFYDLDIGKECVFVFNLPMRVVQNTVDLNVTVKLNGGGEYTSTKYLDFATAAYADKKPKIDGAVEIGEWRGSWIGCYEKKDVKENPLWKGPEDQSFSATMMWDEENFYFLAMVTDDVYSMNITPYTPDRMWQGDNIQFSIDDRLEINPVDAGVINELSIGKLNGFGDICYRHSSYYGLPVAQIVENMDICIKRYEGYTVYEIAAPWSEILQPGFVPSTDRTYRFSVMINENDGTGRKGWMEYNSGIGASKQVDLFGTLKLYK